MYVHKWYIHTHHTEDKPRGPATWLPSKKTKPLESNQKLKKNMKTGTHNIQNITHTQHHHHSYRNTTARIQSQLTSHHHFNTTNTPSRQAWYGRGTATVFISFNWPTVRVAGSKFIWRFRHNTTDAKSKGSACLNVSSTPSNGSSKTTDLRRSWCLYSTTVEKSQGIICIHGIIHWVWNFSRFPEREPTHPV